MPSLYLVIFGIIVICAVITLIKPQYDKWLYYGCLAVMTLFLMLRFGQGTDYPGYLCIYETADVVFSTDGSFSQYLNMIHTEIGWKVCMVLFKFLDMDFWIVIAFFAAVTMLATHLAITTFCEKYRVVALLLLYPTVYLTYYFSGIRQGFAMAVFFGILVKRAIDKKYISYVLGVLLLSTIHKASLCYLIVPIILVLSKKIFVLGTILSFVLSAAMILNPIREIIKNLAVSIGASAGYFGEPTISWFSLLERTVMLAFVLIMYLKGKQSTELKKRAVPLLKIYLTGYLIYICLLSTSFVSSRLAIMFKMGEFLLIPMLMEETQVKIRNFIMTAVVALSVLMSYKNINSYASGYYEGITGVNYPYVSIFNRQDILLYREEFVNEIYDFRERDYI